MKTPAPIHSKHSAVTKLSFDDTKIAFQGKSNADLDRAYWLFKLISSNFLVKVGPPLTNFALNIGLPIKGIIKKTIFKHFCGGESIPDCHPAIKSLSERGAGTILDYSVEGEDKEEDFDQTHQELLRAIQLAKESSSIPFAVFKPSGLGRFELFEKKNAKAPMTEQEQQEFERVIQRIDSICKACYESDVTVLIDAEHSWIQDIIDDLAREMMRRYNRTQPIVFNTYQLYRHDKLASLKADFYFAETDGFYLGAKLVRGAYMEIERERAEEKGYPSPINHTKEATDQDYNDAIIFCLDNLNRIAFMAGTHNEYSCRFLAEEMEKRAISNDHPWIYFAQLLGMSDNLTFNLASAGYRAAKYMPYGPIEAVMPYLFRRAQENTSVAGQTGRELALIMQEKRRRKATKY